MRLVQLGLRRIDGICDVGHFGIVTGCTKDENGGEGCFEPCADGLYWIWIPAERLCCSCFVLQNLVGRWLN